MSPLLVAAIEGNVDVLKILLQRGADANESAQARPLPPLPTSATGADLTPPCTRGDTRLCTLCSAMRQIRQR